jgi:hypothetical protein
MAVEYVEHAALIGKPAESEGGTGCYVLSRRVVLVDCGLRGFHAQSPLAG